MAEFQVDPVIKRNGEELSKQHGVPVNAIGLKIDPKDHTTGS